MEKREQTYEDGVRDGKILALEDIAAAHKDRLDYHSNRLRVLERVIWGIVGAIALLQLAPRLISIIEKMK